MNRRVSKVVLFVVLGCGVFMMSWFFGVQRASAAGSGAHAKAGVRATATVIKVTLGKPSEFAFTLSKQSSIAAGTITFKVTNRGTAQHDFKLCTTPVKSAKANGCVGRATKFLNAGQSATLTVTLTKTGTYEYLCSVPGHAKAGMKGVLGIGVKVTPTPTPTPTPKPTTTTTTTTTPAAPCNNPVATTVTVAMFEYGFTMSQNSIPCGSVTFIENNIGTINHDFVVPKMGFLGTGPNIAAGQKASFTVTLAPGTYDTLCDIPQHAQLGMAGQFTVTG